METLIQNIKGPIKSLIQQMYDGKILSKELLVTSEHGWFVMKADLSELIEQGYLSLRRSGKKVKLKILKKGQGVVKMV